MLRVGFNAYLLRDANLRGWNRYTVNLLAALPTCGVRPVLYSLQPVHPEHLRRLPPDSYEVCVAPPMRYLVWLHYWLPRRLRQDGVDLFHCPVNYGLPWTTPCPRVLTLHDAVDLVYYLPRLSWRQQWRLSTWRMRWDNWSARRRAHHIITVSEHARGDIVRRLRVPASKVSVIYEAADPHFHQPLPAEAVQQVRQRWGLTRPYLLYVGGWEGRKNVEFLVRAFVAAELAAAELVLAGGTPSQQATMRERLQALGGRGGSVRLLGYVPEEDLPALYAGAWAFVYPSEYEGFGLQVCEAMAVGCPVLVARATSLPEIAGSGGESFDVSDPAELAGLLRRVAGDAAWRAELAERSRRRGQEFSWDRTAAQTVAVYQRLLRRASG